MESVDLSTNEASKVTKTKEKRTFRVPLNLSRSELSRYAALAVEANCRPKLQKLFKISKKTGKEVVDRKGIQEFIRDHAMPEYEAHAWEREQKAAAALQQVQEGQAVLEKLGKLKKQ